MDLMQLSPHGSTPHLEIRRTINRDGGSDSDATQRSLHIVPTGGDGSLLFSVNDAVADTQIKVTASPTDVAMLRVRAREPPVVRTVPAEHPRGR